MDEKLPPKVEDRVPQSAAATTRKTARRRIPLWPLLPTLAAIFLGYQHAPSFSWNAMPSTHGIPSQVAGCAQVDPLVPSLQTGALDRMDDFLRSETFSNESVSRLAGAIQIPSQSYDDLGAIGEDPRWDIMYEMAAYLEQSFPLVHAKLRLDKVNTHGLLYTWEGSDPLLKPTVLMAHQDVVPVAPATVGQWKHPPFGGVFDGKHVWGRGASDCKNTLIGIMEAVELLVKAGFDPKRTLLISFGFDEEISGREGAGHLAPFILDRYGRYGIAAIVDEGPGMVRTWGTDFALPCVGEKGYVDIEVVVRMPGGHSSIPPQHTGIGVMSELITLIEAHPYEPRLYSENPCLSLMQCGAAHAPSFPSKLKKLLPGHSDDKASDRDRLADEVAKQSPVIKYLFTTSVAVDVIGGGVKNNALPERTRALINHRINVGEHASTVQDKLTKLAATVADKYGLALHAFDSESETPSSITLMTAGAVLEPAPVTPTITDGTPYGVLSGTTRALYGENLIMAPAIMPGNTDTRYYWDLSRHIFRFVPGWDPDDDPWSSGIHTVNERVSILGHVRCVQWFSMFVRNMDEAELN